MPRFFFHLRNDLNAEDEEGLDCSDLAAARDYAVKSARGLAAESVLRGRLQLGDRIEIQDESGKTLASVSFRDAVVIEE